MEKYNMSRARALTDNILLYLTSQNLSRNKIIGTYKNMESVKGTGQEWWTGNRTHGYLRYAVRAKKRCKVIVIHL